MTPTSEEDENIEITTDDLKDEPYIEAEHCGLCHKQTDEIFAYKKGWVCSRCLPKLLTTTTKDYIEDRMKSSTQFIISIQVLSQKVIDILELGVDASVFADITQKYVKLQQIAKDLPYMIKKERGNIHISV